MAVNKELKEKIERIKYMKGLTQFEIASQTDVQPSYLSDMINGRVSYSDSFKKKLYEVYSDLFEDELKGKNDTLDSVIMIPTLSLDARGGFLPNDEVDANSYIAKYEPFSREVAREGDFVVPVYGDSMEPKYPSGSMILIRNVEMWREYIEYGASYVIELVDKRRIIKNIQQGKDENSFLLVSINEKYEPSEIEKSLIRSVFRVIMSVRRESM